MGHHRAVGAAIEELALQGREVHVRKLKRRFEWEGRGYGGDRGTCARGVIARHASPNCLGVTTKPNKIA